MARRRRAWVLAWLFIAALLGTVSTARQGSPGGRLRGVVVDTDTGQPIRGVTIAVAAISSRGAPATAVTDPTGRYSTPLLSSGSYVVTASRAGYATATFGRRHAMDVGGTIDVVLGFDRSLVDFQLSREAILEGRVAGKDGRGLSGLTINVLRPHLVDGRRKLVSFATTRTDAIGDYRVGGLLTGDYYVTVSLFERADSRFAQYAPTFFPGSANVATANRVYVTSGATVRVRSMTPLPVPWAQVKGRLKSSDGRTLIRGALIMQARDIEGLSYSPDAVIQLFPDGRFAFDFVVPGHYVVRAQGGTEGEDSNLFASWAVDVGEKPVDEETMTLKPGSSLSGVVRFEAQKGTPAPTGLSLIRVHTPLLDGTGFGAESGAPMRPDATFTLTSVDAGKTVLQIVGLPSPWSLGRIMQGDQDITDVPLDVVQGQKLRDVEIVLTDVVTGLTGQVRTRAGVPVVNYLVVVFPLDRANWRPLSRHILTTRTDWEGRYRLASLPPGSYRVGAVIDFEEEDIYDREALDQIDLRCVSVVLASGELRVTDLDVTIGQRSGGG